MPITFIVPLCLSLRPCACINAAPTVWISVKLHIGYFYENMSRNPKFGQNREERIYRTTYMRT